MPIDTSQVVSECIAGVPGAANRLVKEFKDQVFCLCYRMLGQREDAEDATQETFIRVIRNLHRFDLSRRFEPWLFTIAGNRCRSKLLKRKQQKEIQLAEQIDYACRQRSSTGILEEVQLAVDRLNTEYQKVFELFHHQQYSYNEIAEELKVPVGTVKTWVHRARKQIADQLRRRKTLEVE